VAAVIAAGGAAHPHRAMRTWRCRRNMSVHGQVSVSREAIAVVHSRYEVRINARLSDRARGAFSAMHVTPVPAQTLLVGELALPSDLSDLLARCMAMGLEVLSLRQLPGNGATPGDTRYR
jgi:hypothetical protein